MPSHPIRMSLLHIAIPVIPAGRSARRRPRRTFFLRDGPWGGAGPVVMVGSVLRVAGGEEVEREGGDVEGEDEGDDPLDDGGDVVVVLPVADAEGWEERNF